MHKHPAGVTKGRVEQSIPVEPGNEEGVVSVAVGPETAQQNFDRYLAIETDLAGAIHYAHPATSDFLQELIIPDGADRIEVRRVRNNQLGPGPLHAQTALYQARVKANETLVRSGPSLDPIIYPTNKLNQGDYVKVTKEREDGWFRLSVGAVSPGEIERVMPKLRSALVATKGS